jgi:hypothetical protein
MRSHAALLPIFRLSKARGVRIPAAVCNRRATRERRKSGANPEGGVAGYLNRLLRRGRGFAARGLSLGGGDLPAYSKWMRKENKIDPAHKISNTARRTR